MRSPDKQSSSNSSSVNWKPSNLEPLGRAIPRYRNLNLAGLELFDRGMYATSGSDAKGVVLVLGVDNQERRAGEIRGRAKASLAPKTWLPTHSGIANFLENSYTPTGVTDELIRGGEYHYVISEDGASYIKPATAALVRYAGRELIPATSIFGDIATSAEYGNRSYNSRTALLLSLNLDNSYVAKLSRDLQLRSEDIGNMLEALDSVGFVNYKAVDTEQSGWVVYEKVKPLAVSEDQSRLEKNIVKFFEVNDKANTLAIAKALGRKDQLDIIDALSEMVVDGFLKRIDWYGSVVQSDARITPAGKEFMRTVLLPILEAYSGDQDRVRDLGEILEEVTLTPTLATRAIQVYREKFPNISRETTANAIINSIRELGARRTGAFIEQFGDRATPVLKELLETGRLINVRRGRASFFLLPGMVLEDQKKVQVEVAFRQPADLEAETCHPKEYYLKNLATLGFWEGLIKDLDSLPEQEYSESYFYRYYDADNPDWAQSTNSMYKRVDHKSGKYPVYIQALRKSDVGDPIGHLRDFKPSSDDPKLLAVIARAKELIRLKFRQIQRR